MQDRQAPLDVFVGRAAELARVAEVVTRMEAGEPWLVAVEGDPGMGKTALARRCLAQASGLRVLSARAGQAEADLDFGLVDQLFRATGGVVEPVVTAGVDGAASSSFAVGARLLEVVGEQQVAGAVAILVDDLQWADRRSVEALTFMLRRLSVDPVIAVVVYRGPVGRLDEAAQRLLGSVENRVRIPLGGLGPDEVASLAAALTAGPVNGDAVRWLHQGTGGHPLYLRTVLSEGFHFDRGAPGRLALPGSLAAAVGDQLRQAELRFSEALAEARHDPDSRPLAALIADRLAATYALAGDGQKVMTFARWALDTGCLDAATAGHARTLAAIGASETAGPHEALAELEHLDADPARVDLVDADGLAFRGVFHLMAGDLAQAVRDMTASLKMERRGVTLITGLRACCYLALAQYLGGAWDDALLTCEQGFSATATVLAATSCRCCTWRRPACRPGGARP